MWVITGNYGGHETTARWTDKGVVVDDWPEFFVAPVLSDALSLDRVSATPTGPTFEVDALDPDAVRVEINPIHNCYHCDLFNDTNCKHLILNPVAGAPVKVPGPDCLFNKMPLGEDEEYVLVKRRKVE